jgi:hypothetical protein
MNNVIDLDIDAADGLTPPVGPSTLLPQILRNYLSEGQAVDLALDVQFMNAGCHAPQIVRLMGFSSIKLDGKLSIRSVARAFNIDHSAVNRALLDGSEDPPGR